jgi:hypothetical protein
MKKSTLKNFLSFSAIRDNVSLVDENGFRMDFSQVSISQASDNSIKKNFKTKKGVISVILLVLVFLLTNFLFAQPPACNLIGPLKATFDKNGGQIVTVSSEVANSVSNSVYVWSFKSNTSNAKFVSQNGKPTITVSSGTKGGSFELELKLINPKSRISTQNNSEKSCSCIQSISVNN